MSRTLHIVAALVVVGTLAHAQEKITGFAGTWVLDPARSDSTHQSPDAPKNVLTITALGNGLQIENRRAEAVDTLRYLYGGADLLAEQSERPVGTSGSRAGVILKWDVNELR